MGTTARDGVTADLSFLLSQCSHVLATELTAGLADLGITPRDYCVLNRAMTGEFTQIRLAELSGLDKTTMVVTLDELEKAGLAERRPSETDRRVRIVEVTSAGRQMVSDAEKVVDQIHAEVLAALPAGERTGFVNGLLRLVNGRLSTPVHCDRQVRRRTPRA